ncbi:MAG: M28 family peptidase [Nitrososphaeria archaeon]
MAFDPLIQNLLKQVSKDEMAKHVQNLCKFTRVSGTEDEEKAVEYIVSTLKKCGVKTDVYEFDSLISQPKQARVDLIYPTLKSFKSITHPFSLTTPEEGVVTELLYVGKGSEEDYNIKNVRGKIVLTDGNASPDKVWLAQNYGVIGQIFISNENVPHEMIITTVWGTPSIKTSFRIPRIYVASVPHEDGEILKLGTSKGKVIVRLYTQTNTTWAKLRIPVATIEGKEEPERFVLIGGHLDSWYVGATDNATGNASCLEIARVLNENKEKLRRSVKIAWWVGHSQGRYSGSTYFVDKEWDNLNSNCISYINIDSPGSKGATVYLLEAMPEAMDFSEEVARTLTGIQVERLKPGRWGDQSFWGIGVPSIDCYSMAPVETRANVGGSGGGWWWHTPYDTEEYVDTEYLVRDTEVNLAIALTLINSKVLPFKLSANAERYLEELLNLKDKDSEYLVDYDDLIRKAGELKSELLKLENSLNSVEEEKVKEVNDTLIRLSRILNPTLFTAAGRYEQDPAVDQPYLPMLNYVLKKDTLGKDNYQFLKVTLRREGNRVSDTLLEAIKVTDECLRKISK